MCLLPRYTQKEMTDTENKVEFETTSEKKKKLVPIIAIVVALAVLVAAGVYFVKDRFTRDDDLVNLENQVKAELGQLENKSNEEIEAALAEVIEEGMIRVSINMNPVFPTGDAEGSLQLENHPNNLYNLRCVITADTNGDGEMEEIYHSGLMPINSHIQTDKLEVDLDKGEYDAIATFTAYDVDTDAEVGIVNAQIRISVLN